MALITKRNILMQIRLPLTSSTKIIWIAWLGVLIAFMFYDIDGSFEGVRNRNGVLYYCATIVGYFPFSYVVLIFPQERPIFLRE